jgi:hypothetical protein
MPRCNDEDTDWDIIRRESEQTSGTVWNTREQGVLMERTKLKAAGSKEQAGVVVHEQETDLDQFDWEKIDWPAMEREVNRFQARIVKAEQEGRWNRVKKLQYLLTRSRAARLLAVRRVTENQGSKTPGVDGQT